MTPPTPNPDQTAMSAAGSTGQDLSHRPDQEAADQQTTDAPRSARSQAIGSSVNPHGVTHTVVRAELGGLDSSLLSEETINRQIQQAARFVEKTAPDDPGQGGPTEEDLHFAVTAVAAFETLKRNRETWEETFEAIDLRTTDNVEEMIAAFKESRDWWLDVISGQPPGGAERFRPHFRAR